MRIYRSHQAAAVLACAILLLATGCISSMGMTSATTPVQGRQYEVLGKSEGCAAGAWAILGLWAIGRPDIDRAIEKAAQSKKGDALINVRWYTRTWYFFLFSVDQVIVKGDVIRFSDNDVDTGKGKEK